MWVVRSGMFGGVPFVGLNQCVFRTEVHQVELSGSGGQGPGLIRAHSRPG